MNELIMYRESDFDVCLQIYVDAFLGLGYDFITKEKAERYIRDLTKTPGFLGYVYWVDGEAVAFCFGTLDNYFQGVLFELAEFAVTPRLQRGGLGSQVMAVFEEKLRMYHVSAVSLHTSRELPAFGFYKKNGYEEVEQNVTLMKWLGE